MSFAQSFGKRDAKEMMDWVVFGNEKEMYGSFKNYSNDNEF